MNDALAVGLGQRLEDLHREAHAASSRQAPFGLQNFFERLALEEFHREVQQTIWRLTKIEHPHSVGMLQACRQPRLGGKALGGLGLGHQIGSQHFQRHRLVRTDMHGAVDVAKPAAT